MRDNALYFPYIRVPQNSWFNQILLYWDKVSSIVPTEYLESPERLGRYMQELVVAELVTQILPSQYIHQIMHFEENFLKYIDMRLPTIKRSGQTINDDSPLIHVEKLGGIGRELEHRGLAVHSHDDRRWYRMVEEVADAFMVYLASNLGQLEDINSAPVTQDLNSYLLLGGKSPFTFRAGERPHQAHTKARTSILDKLLPVPEANLKISELVNFKAKYGGLLKSFREKIEKECKHVSKIRNEYKREQKLIITIKRLENDIREIEEKMKSTFKKIIFKSLRPLLEPVTSSLYESDLSSAVSWGAASVGCLIDYIYSTVRERREVKEPLAYAAFIRHDLLQNHPRSILLKNMYLNKHREGA